MTEPQIKCDKNIFFSTGFNGRSVSTPSERLSLRAVLLTTVAAGTLMIASPDLAEAGPDACTVTGTTVTCSDDQSAGIASGTDFAAPPIETLIVDGLTGAITPAAGTDGIDFSVTGGNDVIINANTGPFGIITTGNDAEGINGEVNGLPGGNITITNSGDVSTTGDNAEGINGYVEYNGDIAITNSGDITTQGDASRGLYGRIAENGDVIITNSGAIKTEGVDAEAVTGVIVRDGNVTIINSGNIETEMLTAEGLYGRVGGDGDVNITNSGDIITKGLGSEGVFGYVGGDGNITITNSGNIKTEGANAVGLSGRVFGNGNVTITTSGDVTSNLADGIRSTINNATTGTHRVTILSGVTVDGGDDGVEFVVGSAFLTNFGTIKGGDDGVTSNSSLSVTNTGTITAGDNAVQATNLTSLTNSGKITGGNHAIIEDGGADTLLTLLPGSDIFGQMDLGAGINTLNVGNGLSIDHEFVALPQIINTNGASFVTAGNRVVVVDPTLLAQQDEVLFDLTQGIWGTVFQNIGDGRNPGGASNGLGGPQYSLGATASLNGTPDHSKSHMWASVFGNRRIQDGDTTEASARHDLYGFIGGVDGRLNSQVRLGGFLGFSETEIDTAANQQEADVESYFGGLYASLKTDGLTFDLGLTGGATKYDNTRQVDNNRVNGLETVSSSFDGTFVAPELSVSTRTDFAGMTLQPTLRAGYAGLFLDGFTETGGMAPLTVADRDIHILHARFELALLMSSQGPDSLGFNFSPFVGVDGRSLVDGESVNVTLLGQNLSFNPGGKDDIASVFAGFRFNVAKTESFGLFAGVEGSLDTEENSTITGNLGVKWKF